MSVFNVTNARGYFLPSLNIQYQERASRSSWTITAGGSRIYLARFGEPLVDDREEQAAESHFMVRRLMVALVDDVEALVQFLNERPDLLRRVLEIVVHRDDDRVNGGPLMLQRNLSGQQVPHAGVRSLVEDLKTGLVQSLLFIPGAFPLVKKGKGRQVKGNEKAAELSDVAVTIRCDHRDARQAPQGTGEHT